MEIIMEIISDFSEVCNGTVILCYVITSERRNICTHEDMYKLTCIKCGKTISINLADPNYINK